MDKRKVNAWCAYDFGNSSFAVLFPAIYGAFFADHVVGENGEFWWGLVGSVSMAAVALSAPFTGGIADHAGIRKRMLGVYTALGVIAVLGFGTVGPGTVGWGLLLGIVANFAFEGGIVFYNAYLPDIAPPSRHGRISARGFAIGYVGSLVALAIAAPLAANKLIVWVWIAIAIQWTAAAVPALRILPADRGGPMTVRQAARAGLRKTRDTWRDVLGMRKLRLFLLGYFFYMDGVNTVIWFAAVYAKRQLGFETGQLVGLLAVVQLTALLGSILMGGPTDKKGPLWSVRLLLGWWILVVVAAGFVTTPGPFWFVAALAGLGLGGIQASSRALMSSLIPKGREAELFGFYALCGKTGAIVGPLTFGLLSAWSTRGAVLTVALFYVAGLLLLRKLPNEKSKRTAM